MLLQSIGCVEVSRCVAVGEEVVWSERYSGQGISIHCLISLLTKK